ncbi:FkbM family methyltransferase [Tardiphaga sp. 803_E3_N1_3]|uniref:FkbM family methyltransferase n=1 Tax=Tardiphaga sp. 803_E3_N1_3 TaxID=3240785 RepID=UPI003F268E6C
MPVSNSQSHLVALYRFIRLSGVFETRWGWLLYSKSYRTYKRFADRDLLILKNYTQSGGFVIDVGANVGSSTLQFASWVGKEGRVVAIEPEARNAAELLRFITRRGLSELVTVIQSAASDKAGSVMISVNKDNPGDHRIASKGVMVPAVTVDELTSLYPNRKVSVLKIDVQGAEPLVLRGAARTIAVHHPVLFVEVFQEGLAAFGSTPAALVSSLEQLGYKSFTISAGKAIASSASQVAQICHVAGYTDVLFLDPKFHQLPMIGT